MKQYLPILKTSNMFQGIDEQEISAMLSCLNAHIRTFQKKEYILRSGEPVQSIGIILSGFALIEKEDFWGNRSIISELSPGMSFAESYACLAKVPVETNVLANKDCTIMFFDIQRILTVCTFHTKLIQNLLNAMAYKNVTLTKKIDYISKKTIRDRLLSYLSTESFKYNRSDFFIPFDRQQLADYLSVDRSALSKELGRLQKEGVLTCRKNHFHLSKQDPFAID